MLLLLSLFFLPFIPLCPETPLPPAFPYLSSCPWVIHISSLASPLPILFLTYPCLFYAYHLCFLFPVPFSPISPLPLPTDNSPYVLHFCDSVPVLVCLSFLILRSVFIVIGCIFFLENKCVVNS